MPKASVLSFEALEILDLTLARFAERTAVSLEATASAIERGMNELEDRRAYWSTQTRYWQDEYDSADAEEDDLSIISYKIAEAQEQVENVERWQSRVEERVQSYSRYASQVDELGSSRILEARTFLRKKIDTLMAWAATSVNNGRHYTSADSNPTSSSPLAPAGSSGSSALPVERTVIQKTAADLTWMPLPSGFRWVRLDEISPEEMKQLPDESDFRKVEYKEMQRGFEVLQNEILPILKSSPENANSDYFWQRDHQRGLDESNGSQRVFNAFFGTTAKDHIYLERRKGDPYFSVTNGRHRIKVARDLGWQALPVEANEVG